MARSNGYLISCKQPKSQPFNTDIPLESEVHLQLGTALSQILFDYGHYDSRRLLKLRECSKGLLKYIPITCQLCSTELTTKIKSNETSKACTHSHILDEGQDLLKRHELEVEEKVRKKMLELFEDERCLIQAAHRREIELKFDDVHGKYEDYFKNLYQHFEESKEVEVLKTALKYNKKMQKAVVLERMHVIQDMLQKMRCEASYIVTSLHEEFEKAYRVQRENMMADFNIIIRKKHVHLNDVIREMERQNKEILEIQKREMELKNLTDMIYLLCIERLRSNSQKHELHAYFKGQVDCLKAVISEQHGIIKTLQANLITNKRDRDLLEEKLCKFTKEFQKFINFTLHSVPDQVEYLLKLNKSVVAL